MITVITKSHKMICLAIYILFCVFCLPLLNYGYLFCFKQLQDTLKASPPSENKAMKRASLVGVSTTTFFYMLCGCVGYAAFGNNAPGNFLTGFGFYEPFWLIDFANVCIAVHLIGAYQVFCQPIFQFVESQSAKRWPDNKFVTREYKIQIPYFGHYGISFFRLFWRTSYVVVTAVVAMIFPFFNDFLGLIGAASFWPLTVYFPIEMHIAQKKMKKFSFTWTWLKILSWVCFLVSLVAAAGSVQGLIQSLKYFKPFQAPQWIIVFPSMLSKSKTLMSIVYSVVVLLVFCLIVKWCSVYLLVWNKSIKN